MNGELIVVVAHNNRQFTYSAVMVQTSGRARTLLKGSLERSYSGIALRSLAGPMTLRVRDRSGGAFVSSVVDFNPSSGVFTPSCRGFGPPGDIGVFSPDGTVYAYANAPAQRAAATLITCADGQPPAVSELVDPAKAAPSAWYASLSWAPSGKRIVATRLWRDGRDFQSELRLLGLGGGITTVLPAAEHPIASAFVSDDSLVALAGEGIVAVGLRNARVSTVFPRSGFRGRIYKGGGMAWMPKSQCVALSLYDAATDTAEIWKIHLADGGVGVLYKKKHSLFFNTLCIESQ